MIYIREDANKKVPGTSSLFVKFDYNPEIVTALKTVPNFSYDDKNKEWEIPILNSYELIDKLSLLDDINLKIQNTPNKKPKTFKLQKYKTKPFAYQEEGIQFGLNHSKWLLLDAPGLGKTLQLIYLAQELKSAENIKHCLIICGINTLKTNWKKEIEKHSNLSCRILGQRINKKGKLVIEGVAERLKQLNSPIEEFFVVTNIETLRDKEIIKAINSGPNKFDMIIVDEIHTCKSPTSAQGANLLKLNRAKYRIGATGTLLLNNPLDLYVPLKWIESEHCNYTNFRYYYCVYTGQFNNILSGFKHLEALKLQLDDCSLRRTKDLLDLPPKTVINEYVDMSPKQALFYENIIQGIVEQVDKVKMTTSSILGMVSRLRQATACPSILTSENIPSAKIDRAVDLAEQIIESGEKVVIFSTFKPTLDVLADKLSKYKTLICTGDFKDSEISDRIDTFQNDSAYPVMLASWQKMGTGITLTAARYAIFIDVPWVDGVYQQCQDRIYRIGTNKSVTIYHLITTDTIDERVLEIVEDKSALASYVIDDTITEQGLQSLRKFIEELQ